MSEIETRVIETIRAVFANKGMPAPPLDGATLLDNSLGLDSLDYAELVARLEMEFGFDPFADGPIPSVRVIADLVSLYATT
jgi:acyl carrier protein